MESQLDRIEILDPLLTLLDNAWIPEAVPEAKGLSNMLTHFAILFEGLVIRINASIRHRKHGSEAKLPTAL
jgi:hypothetical protein